jgi:hypothetical protein
MEMKNKRVKIEGGSGNGSRGSDFRVVNIYCTGHCRTAIKRRKDLIEE